MGKMSVSFWKAKYCVFGFLPTNKQGWVYVFTNLKISNEKGQQWSDG